MKFLSKLIAAFVLSLLMIFGCAAIATAQTSDSNKQAIIERFKQNNKTDHKVAYDAAKKYFREFPDDTSDDAQYMKKWMTAYEKVEMNNQSSSSTVSQPTNNNSSSSTGTETPEIAEARIAITKYKDYASAIKSLESSSEPTKRTAIWLQIMAIAQEGVGNQAEELKYLEKYNELVPNQKETVEKLADLRYKVKKQQKELDEESRFGTLEQTLAWLKINAIIGGSEGGNWNK